VKYPRCQHENPRGARFLRGVRAGYEEPFALTDELGRRLLVAHCHLGPGKLYRRTGKRDQARDQLVTATSMSREMDMRLLAGEGGGRGRLPEYRGA